MVYSINDIDSLKFNNMYYGQYCNVMPNGYNGFYYSPNFTSQPVQNQYQNLVPLQQDTYEEVSAAQNIKKTDKKGKPKLGKILLWTIGLAGTAYAGVVTHRFVNKPTFEIVQKNLSEIFGKDFSKEEANMLIEKYKNICKNDKTEGYLNKLFEQIKSDMGYEKLDLKLNVEKLKDKTYKTFKEHKTNGSCGVLNKEINIFPRTAYDDITSTCQRGTFGTMFHEFKHVKQWEMSYRADRLKTCQGAVEAIEKQAPEFIEQLMKENNSTREQVLADLNKEFTDILDSLFKDMPKYEKGSKEYDMGLKYIENHINYIKDGPEYCTQLVEKEAFDIGDKARKIYDYFANPWRIF